MSDSHVPTSIEKFLLYMKTTDDYLLQGIAPNQVWNRFNWLPDEQAQWHTYAVKAAAYAIDWHSKLVNMTTLRGNIHQLMQDVRDFIHKTHVLERISAQSPTLAVLMDFIVFNIIHNRPVPNTGLPIDRKAATKKHVEYGCVALGGGDMKFICRVEGSKSKHAAKLRNYNIETYYKVLGNADTTTTPPTPAEPVPTSVTELKQHITNTHAHFILHLGGDTANHRLATSMQWKHKTNPALDGPLSPIMVFAIS